MDRLEKVIKIMIDEHDANCGEHDCLYCKYYNGDCNLDYLMDALFKWDKTIPKEKSIVLKNIDISNKTFEELYMENLEAHEEFANALVKLMTSNGYKKAFKENYIKKMLELLQAHINIANFCGITVDDIMDYYNNK